MPELPEVETVRRSLAQHLLGRRITHVQLFRPDIVTGSTAPAALLVQHTIVRIWRHGKHLALLAHPDPPSAPAPAPDNLTADHLRSPLLSALPALEIHLGMTGSLLIQNHDPLADRIYAPNHELKHRHILWTLDDGCTLAFHDPRRFGGLWTYPTFHDLHLHRWQPLGPDALDLPHDHLHRHARHRTCSLKAALLDQSLLAGVGNIYADEAMFRARIRPTRRCHRLRQSHWQSLSQHIHDVLRQAVHARGSSLRDYVDAQGQPGDFQTAHQVYGRSGQPCLHCQRRLHTITLAGRTTVYCPNCQR